MIRRDRRFADVVERQLDLFATDESDLVAEGDAALRAYDDAPRDGAEEAYGDYQLVVDAIADALLSIRESYASTLEDGVDDDYRAAFNRAASGRFRRHPTIAADLLDT